MAPVELVIFDCDGVLVDSERLTVDLDVDVLVQFGLRFTRDEVIDQFVGRSDGLIEATIEASLGRPLSPIERERIDRLHVELFEQQLEPVDGVVEALQAIPYRMCVASGSNPESLLRKLRLCGLLEWFDGRLFSSAQVAEGKPAPDLFLFAAESCGVPPSRCVVVEDSRYGVAAARAAGMRAFAYVGGMVAPASLAGPGTVLFDDMRRLPALIADLVAA